MSVYPEAFMVTIVLKMLMVLMVGLWVAICIKTVICVASLNEQ